MFQYILFDLDGTLTDPKIGITNSVMYSLEKFGIKVNDRKELFCFIGPPLIDSFMDFYGFSKEDALQAIVYYREFFGVTGIYQNDVYDGIENVLATLKNQGKKLILATSKPEKYANIILEHFGLAKYFDCVVGATFDGSLNYKSDIVAVALKRGGVDDISKAIMIGDRHHDVDGGKANSLATIGVLYGYGSMEEFNECGADFVAETPADILRIINTQE
jgi:phosphoglycolate phosphatase